MRGTSAFWIIFFNKLLEKVAFDILLIFQPQRTCNYRFCYFREEDRSGVLQLSRGFSWYFQLVMGKKQ